MKHMNEAGHPDFTVYALTQIENGKRSPTGPLLDALAKYFLVPAETLKGGKEIVDSFGLFPNEEANSESPPKPWHEVPMGDLDDMPLAPEAWVPESREELWANDPVAKRFRRWDDRKRAVGSQVGMIRISRNGKKSKRGEFKFTLRDGVVHFAMRADAAVVHRRATQIAYLGMFHRALGPN